MKQIAIFAGCRAGLLAAGLALFGFVVAGAIGEGTAAQEKAPKRKASQKAIPAKTKPKKGRADRYPLPYPPKLPDGKTSVTEQSQAFLKAGPNLKPGIEIAKSAPVVDFLFYPEQNYPGNPWSHRSDGIVVGDKYYSSSNDHLAPRGTALLWEYDATAKKFRLLCDTSKFLESVNAFPADMDYRPGEMQSRIDLGSDGWLYYATDRGSPTVTNDAHGYKGEWLLRTHPQTMKTEIVATHPIEKHTIPATVLDSQRMILYCGTAVGKDAPNQKIQFFAFDVKNRKILKVADDGPTRTLIFSKSTGRVFWEGKMYDPETNEITASNVPHVRSATAETPQGIVYGTSERSANIWAFHVKTGELKQLGSGAVASQEYIASIDADPTGRYLYYAPGAHGGASGDGTPVVQLDVQTGKKKVIAFLHDLFWEKYGYALDGSFGSALDEKGERLFISWDGWRKGQPRGWESAAVTVVHIPPSERALEKPASATTGALRLDGRALFEQAVTQNVRLSPSGAVVLSSSTLIEDDGPAAGYSYKPNEETLSDSTWIKKELLVPQPAARKATLLLGSRPGKNGEHFRASINGRPIELKAGETVGNYWTAYAFDPALLRAGKNEIVLTGPGKIWIARDDEFALGSRDRTSHPNRSAKSTDGGKTWDYEHLGTKGDIDGEYYVRLVLDQIVPQGSLTLPIMDIGNLAKHGVAPPVAEVGPVRVAVVTKSGEGRKAAARIRCGTTYVPSANTWSDWQSLPLNDGIGMLQTPAGRYLQVALDLTTSDPPSSPELEEVRIEANPKPAQDWTENIAIVEQHNERIVRSSIPFEYEPFDHPRLAELREKHKLDDIAAKATSEFDLIARLAEWSSRQWQKGHLAESYPAWNALEVLTAHSDGKPVGGFCQQYNLVFLQACESFGLCGRAVSLSPGPHSDRLGRSGHEVVEIWSNEFRKWVYVDGNFAFYAVDRQTMVPLSLWELRGRQLATLDGKRTPETKIVKIADSSKSWTGLHDGVPFAELRLIPRSNFLEQKAPLPLNQGMRGWFWTGHYAWSDEQLPAALLYGNRVEKRGEFEWTLNQAHLVLEATARPGELRVQVDTVTPGFDTFLAQIDGQAGTPVAADFSWKLHPGRNRLDVRPRNIAGREGITSYVVLDYQPR